MRAWPGRRGPGLRWRLQPRAVAARRLGRRHRLMQRGRRQLRRPSASSRGPGSSRPRASTTFDWLDEVMDLLHAGGIAVDLATATAIAAAVAHRGAPGDPARRPRRAHALARQPAVLVPELAGLPRAAPLALTRAAGRALPRPPGPRHVARVQRVRAATTCPATATPAPSPSARWLARRYGDLDALNEAWGTAFWSQRYTAWDRSCRLGARRRSATRRTSSTSTASAPTPCSTLPRRARRAPPSTRRACRSPRTS